MNDTQGRLPRASREQVLAAVTHLEHHEPVTVGRLGMRVAQVMGVDMTDVATFYDLRSVISWQSLQSTLKELAEEGALVRRTARDWHGVTHGRLFKKQMVSPQAWAYCTPQRAQEIRRQTMEQLMMARAASQEQAAELMREHPEGAQYARRVFHQRYPQQFAALVQEWVRKGGVV